MRLNLENKFIFVYHSDLMILKNGFLCIYLHDKHFAQNVYLIARPPATILSIIWFNLPSLCPDNAEGEGCSMLIVHLENATISNILGCFYCLCSPVSESDTNTFEMWKLYIKPIFISIVVTHLSRYYSVIVLSHTAICYTHDSSKVHFCEQQASS